jgi:uncharacterized protein YbjT (DUF2867 family)
VIAEATRAIVDAADQKGLERVVRLSSFGVARDRLAPVTKVVTGIAMGSQIRDKADGEEVLRASRLDWTIVYATKLTNGPETEARVVPESEKVRLSQTISRAAVASFLLQAATENVATRDPASHDLPSDLGGSGGAAHRRFWVNQAGLRAGPGSPSRSSSTQPSSAACSSRLS